MWRDQTFFLLHDNARSHTAAIVQQFLAKKGVAQLSHSPDLSVPDYSACVKLKLELKSDHYASIEDIQESVTTKLKAFSISDFLARRCVFKCQGTISNKYYLFEFFGFIFQLFHSVVTKLTGHTL